MGNKKVYPIDLDQLIDYLRDHNIYEFKSRTDIINKFGENDRCNANKNECKKYATKEFNGLNYCEVHYNLLNNKSVKRPVGIKVHELKRLVKLLPDDYIEKVKHCTKYRTYKIRYCIDGYKVVKFIYITTDDSLKDKFDINEENISVYEDGVFIKKIGSENDELDDFEKHQLEFDWKTNVFKEVKKIHIKKK